MRSTPGISAVEGLRYSEDLLKRYGGHTGAAGFSLDEAQFGAFRERIHAYVRQFPTPTPRVRLDAALPTLGATHELVDGASAFEPFGEGHAPPLWHVRDLLSDTRLVGKRGDSLQFRVARCEASSTANTTPRRGNATWQRGWSSASGAGRPGWNITPRPCGCLPTWRWT